jgi:hypothetical protein
MIHVKLNVVKKYIYLVLKFLFDLNLVIRFSILKLRFLGFAHILIRSICHFLAKVNRLSF